MYMWSDNEPKYSFECLIDHSLLRCTVPCGQKGRAQRERPQLLFCEDLHSCTDSWNGYNTENIPSGHIGCAIITIIVHTVIE